jgi:hypothetical protein
VGADYSPGCTANSTYSSTTGKLCDKGCTPASAYSTTSGKRCDGNTNSTTSPYITLIDKDIIVAIDDIKDQAQATFNFKVYSPKNEIYVSRKNPEKILQVTMSGSPSVINPKVASLEVTSPSSTTGADTADYYLIKRNETRTFSLSVVVEPTKGAGMYRVRANTLKLKNGSIKFGSEFVSDYVYLSKSISTQPSITVISPNGGVVDVSKPVIVAFITNNVYPAKHYINLVDETLGKAYSLDSLLGSYGVSFTQAQINEGKQSITVKIPESYKLDLTHKYKIEICVNKECIKSDSYFTITSASSTQPSITVLVPNTGKEEYYWGQDSNITIKYKSANIVGQKLDSYLVAVGQSIDNYGYAIRSSDISAQNEGSIKMNLLNVGGHKPGLYNIAICTTIKGTKGDRLCDYSDKPFKISEKPVPAPTVIPVTYSCKDSDGGINYSVKGSAEQKNNSGTLTSFAPDRCTLKQSNGTGEPVSSCSGSNCYIEEGYCDGTTPRYTYWLNNSASNGCVDGALKTVTSSPSPSPTPTSTSSARLNTSLTANALGAVTDSSSNAVGHTSYRFTQFLSEGSYGNEVKELQNALARRGYDVGNVDGVFGSKVKEAVMKFQADNKLKTDGIVGYEVRTLLNK